MTSASGPPPAVLASFGLAGPAVRLRGGQGTSWRVGSVVLKPQVDPRFQQWLGTQVASVPQRGFRLPTVVRALDGAWVVRGWGAQVVVPGRTASDAATSPGAGHERAADWGAVIDASRALHAATAALTRPAFLDLRADPWAWADRAAWGEVPRPVAQEQQDLVERLDAAPSPMGRAQLVHGDLTSNVLLSPGEPPTILDFSPYWRPPSYAEGIVIADALCWHDAPSTLVDDVEVPVAAVARGLLFRLLTASRVHEPGSAALREETRRHRRVVAALRL